MGNRKSTESVEAVTISHRACLEAEMDATSSIMLINFPPNNVPWLLVSSGNTLLVLITLDCEHVFVILSVIALPRFFFFDYYTLIFGMYYAHVLF
jgi:hypothetical protein